MTTPLLTLTAAAWNTIWNEAESISRNATFDTCYLRVGIRGGGCVGFEYDMDMVLGQPGERDIAWLQPCPDENKFPDPPVRIAVDPISAQYLRGCVIDYVRQGMISGFKFQNPMAKSQCGCGKSFST